MALLKMEGSLGEIQGVTDNLQNGLNNILFPAHLPHVERGKTEEPKNKPYILNCVSVFNYVTLYPFFSPQKKP